MMGAGAFVLPLTIGREDTSTPVVLTGTSLIAGGAVVVWIGSQQRRKALTPTVTVRRGISGGLAFSW